jgi:predicted dehydrogenase/threonine dehydrogenase-like Zn-dependent dehydrogenase
LKQLLIKNGRVRVWDVPAPLVDDGHVLVDVNYSFISAGTERSLTTSSQKSVVERVGYQSERAKNLANMLRERGLQRTLERVRTRIEDERRDPGRAIGYSCAGVVIQVGAGVEGLARGDRVACAGAGDANHAEIVLVPKNLVVKIPDGCSTRDASSVAVGSIALQGVRRAEPRLGDVGVVVGLGLIGQLTHQMLAAAGVRCIGTDVDEKRVALAHKLGLERAIVAGREDVERVVGAETGGHGADFVVVTAASASAELLQQAVRMTRTKGKVVLVGAVPIQLERSPLYEREIDFLISCSYGPGRYDASYERDGVDYPFGYVRWTEARNMAEVLRLAATRKIDIGSLIEHEVDVDDATRAYDLLASDAKPIGIVLTYPRAERDRDEERERRATIALDAESAQANALGVAVVGAGAFARSTLVPAIAALPDAPALVHVTSRSGARALAVAQRFGFRTAGTDSAAAIEDPAVGVVFVAARHHEHAHLVVKALDAGKHVFCEKPLALDARELDDVEAAITRARKHGRVLTVGFNRRFAPSIAALRSLLTTRRGALVVDYRVNAGALPIDHWTLGPQGGGRIRGEACHMIDLVCSLVGAPVRAWSAHPAGGRAASDAIIALRFDDGSIANVVYTSVGNAELPKERIELHFDGTSAVVDDFADLVVHGDSAGWRGRQPDKGHRQLVAEFFAAVRGKRTWPISADELIHSSRLTLDVAAALESEIA